MGRLINDHVCFLFHEVRNDFCNYVSLVVFACSHFLEIDCNNWKKIASNRLFSSLGRFGHSAVQYNRYAVFKTVILYVLRVFLCSSASVKWRNPGLCILDIQVVHWSKLSKNQFFAFCCKMFLKPSKMYSRKVVAGSHSRGTKTVFT